MKILFLCGVFDDGNQNEIARHSKAPVEYSANIFQKKLINGFKQQNADLEIISAPFIGSYPNASDIKAFEGFENAFEEYHYVSFNNIWGIRNISRATALKKALNNFICADDEKKLIVVYSAHTPFLKAAAYAKKKDKRIKISVVVPDLPQYMNLKEIQSVLYKVGKKYDIFQIEKYVKSVDSFLFLTEAMSSVLNKDGKPYFVAEGIVTGDELSNALYDNAQPDNDTVQTIVYTGKLNKKFGVENLTDAVQYFKNDNIRLIICGSGDSEDYIRESAEKDKRIVFLGQISPQEARVYMQRASVLVNPRPDNETYTKYSFPSKNIEYLLTGKPVAAFMLSGMKTVYSDFIYEIKQNSPESIYFGIHEALQASENEKRIKFEKALAYLNGSLRCDMICKKIIDISFD